MRLEPEKAQFNSRPEIFEKDDASIKGNVKTSYVTVKTVGRQEIKRKQRRTIGTAWETLVTKERDRRSAKDRLKKDEDSIVLTGTLMDKKSNDWPSRAQNWSKKRLSRRQLLS